MPLHPDTEAGAGRLDRLDHAVGGARADPQLATGIGDRLVVPAVHRLVLPATELREPRPGGQLDLVSARSLGKPVLARVRQVGGDVVVERAAQLHGHHLHAVADPERGQVGRQGGPQQRGVEREQGLGNGIEAHGLGIRRGRQQVVPARDQDAIDLVDGLLRVALQR